MPTTPSPNDPAQRTGETGAFVPPPAQELRRYGRFKIDGAIGTLKVRGFLSGVGLGPRVKVVQAIDLSEGGALLAVDRRLSPGRLLHVRIDMPKYSDHIESDAEVRWCFQDARNPKHYFIGVMFKGIGEEQKAKISVMRRWFTSKEYKSKTSGRWTLPPKDDPKK